MEDTFQNMNNSQIHSHTNIIFIPKYILIMMEISNNQLPTNTISKYSFMFIIKNLMGTLYIFCPVLL